MAATFRLVNACLCDAQVGATGRETACADSRHANSAAYAATNFEVVKVSK